MYVMINTAVYCDYSSLAYILCDTVFTLFLLPNCFLKQLALYSMCFQKTSVFYDFSRMSSDSTSLIYFLKWVER